MEIFMICQKNFERKVRILRFKNSDFSQNIDLITEVRIFTTFYYLMTFGDFCLVESKNENLSLFSRTPCSIHNVWSFNFEDRSLSVWMLEKSRSDWTYSASHCYSRCY